MKAEDTIKRQIKKLGRLRSDDKLDETTRSVAGAMEAALLWVTEDVRGWPALDTEAMMVAQVIRVRRTSCKPERAH